MDIDAFTIFLLSLCSTFEFFSGNWLTSTLNTFWYSPPLLRTKSRICCCCNYSVFIIPWTCDDLHGCHQRVVIEARLKSLLIVETSKIFTWRSFHEAITLLQKGHLIWTCVSCFPGLGVGGDTIKAAAYFGRSLKSTDSRLTAFHTVGFAKPPITFNSRH